LLEEISVRQAEVDTTEDQQAVIWGWFRYELERAKELLGSKAVLVYGGLGPKVVQERLNDFKAGRVQYLLAAPGSAGHGLTLCEQLPGNRYPQVHHQVFFSLSPSAELYHQASKRIHRSGQKLPVHNYHLLANSPRGGRSIDHKLLHLLSGKFETSAELMDAILETLQDDE